MLFAGVSPVQFEGAVMLKKPLPLYDPDALISQPHVVLDDTVMVKIWLAARLTMGDAKLEPSSSAVQEN